MNDPMKKQANKLNRDFQRKNYNWTKTHKTSSTTLAIKKCKLKPH
jgi:hypothetical protein